MTIRARLPPQLAGERRKMAIVNYKLQTPSRIAFAFGFFEV
jgi:hypothetical protein